jgi:DNA-binding MarR family transcriptional regulator
MIQEPAMKPESETIDHLFVQVSRLHRARAHTLLEELGLYQGQPPVLFALWEREGMTHGELAAQMQIQPATMTVMLQRMEKAGFIERRADAEDERVSRVYLTAAGRDIKAQVQQVWQRLEAETFASIAEEELPQLRRYLTQMRDNLLRQSGAPTRS